MLEELDLKITELYKQMDQASLSFKQASGISCLTSCGKCCKSPEVSATILEMLPMAIDYVESGKSSLDQSENSRCQFFQQSPLHPDWGQCSEYNNRPTVCRLFGWFGTKNKNGEIRLSTCDLIKENQVDLVEKINSVQVLLESLPKMNYFQERLKEIAPHLTQEVYPINLAFQLALEKVMLIKRLSSAETLKDNNLSAF